MIRNVSDLFFLILRDIITFFLGLVGYKMTDEKWESWKQFIQFVLVGCSNAMISLIVYYITIAIDRNLYILGNTLGYIAGIINSYIWNSKFVFRLQNNQKIKNFVRMVISYLFTYFIQITLLYIFIDYMSIHEALAPIIAIIITTPINFALNKKFSFK